MRILASLSQGLRTVRAAGRLVVLLYLINLAFSLVLAVPVYDAVKDSLGRSQAGERMARGFDYQWWEEYRDQGRGLAATYGPSVFGRGALLNNLEGLVGMRLQTLPSTLLLALIIYLVIHTFLAGGILGTYAQESPGSDLRGFPSEAIRYFPRFLGLMLFSWIFFYAVGFVLNARLSSFVEKISRNALTERTPFFAGLAASLLVWFLLMFIQMVFDYARIGTVLTGRANIFRSAGEGLALVAKHPWATFGLSYSLFIMTAFVSVVYVLLKETISQRGAVGVLLAFALQQVFILALVGLRCWTYAGQLRLARALRD
jgi:hypothetical protein